MATIKVTKQYNRFDNTKRNTEKLKYKKQTALELKNNLMPAPVDTDIILNGEIVREPEHTWILPNDDIVLLPKVEKSVLRTILPIALIVASFIIFPASLGWSTTLLTGARIGFVMAGSLLVNAILPPPKPKLPSLGSFDTSPNYRWDARTTDTPDTPIPLIYGKIKTHGTIIASYLHNDGKDNYLNLLLGIAQGEVNWIGNFKINGQPVANYPGVSIEARYGKLYQSAVSNFNATKKEYLQNITITSADGYWYYTTPDKDADQCEVTITFPQGLWYANDRGGLDNNSVSVEISYSLNNGSSWIKVTSSVATTTTTQVIGRWSAGYWTNDGYGNNIWHEDSAGSTNQHDHYEGESAGSVWINDWEQPLVWHWIQTTTNVSTSAPANYQTFTANSTKAFSKTFTFPLYNKQAKIRIKKATADRNNSRYGDTLQVSSIKTVYEDLFTYPLHALVGIKALATNKLSGSFDFTCYVEGRKVWVWDGTTWHYQYSNNPAWICYDILTQPIIKENDIHIFGHTYNIGENIVEYKGIQPDRLKSALPQFLEWANYCDEILADGGKRATFNGIFDQETNMWEMAGRVCSVGRANLLYNGVNLQVIVDRPALPTRPLINVANTIKDSFKETFISDTAKIGNLTVDYLDASNDYNRQQVSFHDTKAGDLSHSVTLQPVGITNLNEAKRYALLMLYHNRYTPRTIQIGMDIDSLNYQVGDVVDVQIDVPEWGEGGRVVSATSTTITLDKQITLQNAGYGIKFRLADDTIIDKNIVERSTTTDTITVSVPFNKIPAQFDLYAIYKISTGIKPFRIVSIETTKDLTATLTLVEYNDLIYSDTDSDQWKTIPAIQYSEIEPLPVVSNLKLSELWTLLNDGTIGDEIVIEFDNNDNNLVKDHEIWYSIDNIQGWTYAGKTSSDNFKLQNVRVGVKYNIAVITVNYLGAKTEITNSPQASINTLGKLAPPTDVTNFTVTLVDFNISMKWDNIPDADLAYYEIKDQTGTIIHSGKQNTFLYKMDIAGNYTFSVRAVDTSDNYSANWTSASITINAPNTVKNLSGQLSGANYIITWDKPSVSDFPVANYQITYGASRTLLATSKITSFSAKVDWGGDRTFYVSAIDAAGNIGAETGVAFHIVSAPATTITATVIDNFALLKWNDVKGSLPIDYYEIRKGSDYATATVIAQQKGNFLTNFETQSGNYTYWVVAVDTAGNYGTEASTTAYINQPADYVLNVDWIDDNSGTKTNIIVDEKGYLLGNVNTTETWAEHFVNNGWNTPQDQINAGYPIYIQPALTNGSYSQTFDYGAVLASTKITVTLTSQAISGNPSYSITISTRKLATDAWTSHGVGNSSVYATDFQYVKVDIALSGTATDLLEISKIEVRLDSKIKNDGGTATINATDTNGTPVNFNVAFVDIVSITVTPQGATQLSAVYDFTDVPNPTTFYVYLFDSTGARASGTVSWQAKGY